MSTYKKSRITISKTPTEWQVMEDKVRELGRSNLKNYLRTRISLLAKEYVSSHKKVCESIEKKEQRQEYVHPSDLQVLELISLKTGMPVAQIVNQMILDPLLRSKP